jgi:hypothetical protein
MAEPDKQYTGDGQDNPGQAAQKAAEAAKQIGQSAAQKASAAGAEATANAAAATVKAGMEGGKAVSEIAAGTAAGGPWGAIIAAAWAMRHTLFKVLVCVCLILVFLITAVVSLPSILFNSIFRTDPSSVDSYADTSPAAIYAELSATVSSCVSGGYDTAFAAVEKIIADGGYSYEYSMQALINHAQVSADYDVCYILAAYSVANEQRGTTRAGMVSKLNAVASSMFPVTYVEKETTITVPAEDEDSEPTKEIIKYVECTIHPFDQSVILSAFGVDPNAQYNQFKITCGEAITNMANSLKMTLYGALIGGNVPPITDAELLAILSQLKCSPARMEIMRVALSLVGRVPYFWGGKSAPGWNADWNTPKLVTSTGSSSTGTIRPYGLDCSGFTHWVYKTALDIEINHGTDAQWSMCVEITEAELKPGDMGWLHAPGASSTVNHILIYVGNFEGRQMWVHCAGGSGVVLNSPTYITHYRRIKNFDLDNMAVPNNSAAGVFTSEEIEWLTAMVYYEARGMDSFCKELTAQVAVNRVGSSKFPNTLEEVLKAPRQYGYGTPGATATLIFNRSYASYIGTPVWNACYEAARKVANGLSVDENGNRWPKDVLFQHSFENPNANGTGLFKTYRSGAYWMHFNYG